MHRRLKRKRTSTVHLNDSQHLTYLKLQFPCNSMLTEIICLTRATSSW